MRNKSDSEKRMVADLADLALRHRRGHDLRRTLLQLCYSRSKYIAEPHAKVTSARAERELGSFPRRRA